MTPKALFTPVSMRVGLMMLAGRAAGSALQVGSPTVVRLAGLPAPPQARFYADCIAASAAPVDCLREPDADVLRFTCSGATARAFYDG